MNDATLSVDSSKPEESANPEVPVESNQSKLPSESDQPALPVVTNGPEQSNANVAVTSNGTVDGNVDDDANTRADQLSESGSGEPVSTKPEENPVNAPTTSNEVPEIPDESQPQASKDNDDLPSQVDSTNLPSESPNASSTLQESANNGAQTSAPLSDSPAVQNNENNNNVVVTPQSTVQDDGKNYFTVTPCMLDHSQSNPTFQVSSVSPGGVSTTTQRVFIYDPQWKLAITTLAADKDSTTDGNEPAGSTLTLNPKNENEDPEAEEDRDRTVKKDLAESNSPHSAEITDRSIELTDDESTTILALLSTLSDKISSAELDSTTEGAIENDASAVGNQSKDSSVESTGAINTDEESTKISNDFSNASTINENSKSHGESSEITNTSESTSDLAPIDIVETTPQRDDSLITTARVDTNTVFNSNADPETTASRVIEPNKEHKTLETLNGEGGQAPDPISSSATDNPDSVVEKRHNLNFDTTTESTSKDESSTNGTVQETNEPKVSSVTDLPTTATIIAYAGDKNVTKTIDITNSNQLMNLLAEIYRILGIPS